MPTAIMEVVLWCAAALFTLLGSAFLYTSIRVFRADENTYRDIQKLYGGGSFWKKLSTSISGTLNVRDGNGRHYLLHKGIAYNRKTKKIEAQGKLSAEALRSIHEPMR